MLVKKPGTWSEFIVYKLLSPLGLQTLIKHLLHVQPWMQNHHYCIRSDEDAWAQKVEGT